MCTPRFRNVCSCIPPLAFCSLSLSFSLFLLSSYCASPNARDYPRLYRVCVCVCVCVWSQ